MQDTFIHPNWHVILIHYPLGLLGVGLLIEILSFFWRGSTVRQAGRWMLLIGALACIPAAAMGVYAFREVAAPGSDPSQTWRNVAARSPWNDEQWDHMMNHLWFALAGTGVAVLAAFVWLACSDRGRQRFYWPALFLMIGALALVGMAAWHGGEGVYRHGVAVEQESRAIAVRELTPTTTSTATQAGHEMIEGTHSDHESEHQRHPFAHHEWKENIEFYVPPLQLHLLLAGLTVAIVLGAFGITLRRWALMRTPSIPPEASETRGSALLEARLNPQAASRPPADPTPGLAVIPQVYPARLWLWAFIFAIATALAGLWAARDWSLSALMGPIHDRSLFGETQRLFGHVAFGSSIALLLLIGAILTRLAKRHRPLTVLVMFLLLFAVAGQAWLGILLLFDSMNGSVTRFNS